MLDEERGDVLADGVQDFSVFPQEAAVEFLADLFVDAIVQRPGLDSLVEVINQSGIGRLERLVSLRATDDFEQFFVHYSSPFSSAFCAAA